MKTRQNIENIDNIGISQRDTMTALALAACFAIGLALGFAAAMAAPPTQEQCRYMANFW